MVLNPGSSSVPGPERVVTVTKEVPGPERVVTVTKEVPGPEQVVTVTKEVPGPERIKEVPGPERIKEVPGPERAIHDAPVPSVASDPPSQNCSTMDGGSSYPCNKPSPYAAKTPEEKPFTEKPEYKDAAYHGRIVKSRDGRELSFEDGKDFHPGHWDNVAGHGVSDGDAVIDSDPYVGDLGMCVEDKDHKQMWDFTAMHNGQVIYIPYKTKATSAEAQPPATSAGGPTTAARSMVMVDVTVGSYPVEAMVDTGCSWPMSVPKAYADALIRVGLAINAGSTPSTLADGSTHDIGVIMIKAITVDGRTLHDVEAGVSPSDTAPILLGLGALNRLGPYSIEEGRLVFTGEQPA